MAWELTQMPGLSIDMDLGILLSEEQCNRLLSAHPRGAILSIRSHSCHQDQCQSGQLRLQRSAVAGRSSAAHRFDAGGGRRVRRRSAAGGRLAAAAQFPTSVDVSPGGGGGGGSGDVRRRGQVASSSVTGALGATPPRWGTLPGRRLPSMSLRR